MDHIDHITLETANRKKLLGALKDPRLPMRRLYQDRSGAAAYILWPSGAQKLLARAAAAPGTADGIICAAYELTSYQADPALAVQWHRGDEYGLNFPAYTAKSTNVSIKPLSQHHLTLLQQLGYRRRRTKAQLRMALRALSYMGQSVRHNLPLSPNWPDLAAPIRETVGPRPSTY
jgi:glycosyl transferase family 25